MDANLQRNEWPYNTVEYDPLEDDLESYGSRLQSHAQNLIGLSFEVPFFSVVFRDTGSEAVPDKETDEFICNNLEKLKQTTSESPRPPSVELGRAAGFLSFYIIAPKFSWGKLQITLPGLLYLLGHFNIHPGFLEVLLTFGRKLNEENESFGVCRKFEGQESTDLYYNLKYVEYVPEKNEWRSRKSGIYSKCYRNIKKSTWLLIKPSSRFVRRLHSLIQTDSKPRTNLEIHLLHLNCANENWTPYCNYLEREFQELDFRASISKPDVGDNEDEYHQTDFQLNFRDVQKLQALTERLLKLLNNLRINQTVIERLKNTLSSNDAPNYRSTLDSYIARTVEHSGRVGNLLRRAENLSILVPYTLARHDNNFMMKLHKEATGHARSMKSITIITMVFLPPTLLAGIFSMFFFEGKHAKGSDRAVGWIVNPHIWYFFLGAALLIAMTLGLWYLSEWRAERQARKEHRKDEEEGMDENVSEKPC